MPTPPPPGPDREKTTLETAPDKPRVKTSKPSNDMYPSLRKIPFFALFEQDEMLDLLLGFGKWAQHPAGSVLVSAGSKDADVFILIKGEAKVVLGKKTLTRLLPPGMFGEIGAFLSVPRSAGVVTVKPSTVFSISVTYLKRLPPAVLAKVMEHLFRITANRLVRADKMICGL